MNTDHDTLCAWVKAAQGGDEAAFGRLATRHYRTVWGLAYGVIGDGEAASDVAQDTLVVAWTHLDRLRTPGAFTMWIRKIARNLARNWLRSADYRNRLAERYRAELNDRSSDAADAPSARSERSAAIQAALRKLSPKVREVMVLFYLEERSIAEVARALDLSEAAVKSRLHQGRLRLREVILEDLDRDLAQELQPHAAQVSEDRLRAHMMLGPAIPAVGDSVSGAGFSLWMHQLIHGGGASVAKPLVYGGIVMSAKKTAVVAVVLLLAGAGAWWSANNRPGAIAPESSALVAETTADGLAGDDALFDDRFEDIPLEPAEPGASDAETPDDAAPIVEREALQAAGNQTRAMTARIALHDYWDEDSGKIENPDEYASVSGHVTTEQGAPISGVTVTLMTTSLPDDVMRLDDGTLLGLKPWRQADRRISAVSDGRGYYEITNITYAGRAFLHAVKPGYLIPRNAMPSQIAIRPGDAITGANIVMGTGSTLHGKVLTSDRRPVPDGQLIVVGIDQPNHRIRGLAGFASTNSAGEFVLVFDRPGTLAVSVSSELHGKTTFTDILAEDGAYVELVMQGPAELHGVISHPGGSPAAGVTIELRGRWANENDEPQSPSGLFYGLTDTAGRYHVADLDPGQYYQAVIFTQERQALTSPIDIGVFRSGESREWNWELMDAIAIRGTVYGQVTGRPLRDIMVAVREEHGNRPLVQAPVGADGSYELHIADGPGQYYIYPKFREIDPNEHGYPSGELVELAASEERELDLTMVDPVTLAVQVIDPAGNPLPDVMIGVREGDMTHVPIGATDAMGRFVYAGLVPTIEVQLIFQTTDGRRGGTQTYVGEPGQVFPEETVVLYESSAIEGVVIAPDGAPLVSATFHITVTYEGSKVIRFQETSDTAGYFSVLRGVPAADVTVRITAQDRITGQVLRWESGVISTSAGQITHIGQVTLSMGSESAGHDEFEDETF